MSVSGLEILADEPVATEYGQEIVCTVRHEELGFTFYVEAEALIEDDDRRRLWASLKQACSSCGERITLEGQAAASCGKGCSIVEDDEFHVLYYWASWEDGKFVEKRNPARTRRLWENWLAAAGVDPLLAVSESALFDSYLPQLVATTLNAWPVFAEALEGALELESGERVAGMA